MKNNYFIYNTKALVRSLIPRCLLPNKRALILQNLASRKDFDILKWRLNFYNRLSGITPIGRLAKSLKTLRFCKKQSVYYFDTYEYARFYPQELKAHFAFGDVNYFLPYPSITKSRPINIDVIAGKSQDNTFCVKGQDTHLDIESTLDYRNSVLLNLEKVRHFTFINDPVPFESKIDLLFYRGGIYQEHRVKFFEKYFSHPLCDLGHTGSKSIFQSWQKPKVSIKAHLPYKFILSLEGNDVASNLKWIMSSNSVAIMPTPKFETWFMESQLKPDYHYIQIASDYSDLEDKLAFHIAHPQATREIIQNANRYVRQFFDKEVEDILSFLVLEKYFYRTGQMLDIDESIKEIL